MRLVPFKKRPEPASPVSAMRRYEEKLADGKPGKRLSPKTSPKLAGTLILQDSRTVRNKFLSFISHPACGAFVRASQIG